MRLGIDLQSAVDDLRGMGRVVRTLLGCFLAEYPQHEYYLFAKNAAQVDRIRQLIRPLSGAGEVVHAAALPELAATELDVCWYPWSRIDVTPKVGRKIVTIHDMARFAYPYRGFLRQWDQRKDEKRYRQAAELADQVITISHFSAREIEKYLHLPAKQILVTPLGVDAEAFAPTHSDETVLPKEYETPFLLFVGGDSEAKNLPTLLQAFALIKNQHKSSLSLVCWGSGEACRKRHQTFLKEHGIEADVFFPELQADDTLLRQLYRKAEVFVFPSIYEGFGLPPLEAMAAGTPVACSKFASLPEVVGDAAIFFDAKSAEHMAQVILHLLTDATVSRTLITRGYQRVKEFTWTGSAGIHMKIFEGSGSI